MDALPVTQKTDVALKSRATIYRGETVGVMHVRGRDSHMEGGTEVMSIPW